MKTFILNGVEIKFDETLKYYDFWVTKGKPDPFTVDFNIVCTGLQSEEIPWNGDTIQAFKLLSRWVLEAPRKRGFRNMILEGIQVASTEHFFECEGGDKFIDGLERTGQLAAQILGAYGEDPVGHIDQPDPGRPATVEEVLGE